MRGLFSFKITLWPFLAIEDTLNKFLMVGAQMHRPNLIFLIAPLFVIVPFLIMAPGLFTAAFTLGVMMQVVNAFGEVKDAFSVFLYNWTRITELRSIHKRLMEFETAINYNTNKLRKPRKSDVRV